MLMVDKKQIIIGIVLICAVAFGAGYKTAAVRQNDIGIPAVTANKTEQPEDAEQPKKGEPPEQAEQAEKEEPRTITVHVTGAVKNPGVYVFNEGARVVDAVKKAEETKDAECSYINLAEIMRDQQQIYVPKKGETRTPVTGSSSAASGISGNTALQDRKININTASVEELDKLPGIGPSFAQRIIDYRNQHGGFKSVADLLKVSGIGEKKYAQIKDRVTVQ